MMGHCMFIVNYHALIMLALCLSVCTYNWWQRQNRQLEIGNIAADGVQRELCLYWK
jgi:hypothetical protein